MDKNPNTLLAVLWAGLACGVLDITAALVVYGYLGLKPMRLLEGIASGLLGPKAFDGGLSTALLGLLCHFVIAYGAATVFFCGEPRNSFFDTECRRFRCSIWRGRLFLHEPHRAAALGGRQASVFPEADDHRRDHTHLLRRTSHLS